MRGTIEKADEMIRSLDDCIGELEAGMATVYSSLQCKLICINVLMIQTHSKAKERVCVWESRRYTTWL